MFLDPTQKQKNQEQFKYIEYQKPQRETTRNLPSTVANSVTERNFLWLGDTITDILTLEINISQYARETKHLTLRDSKSYLVPDG